MKNPLKRSKSARGGLHTQSRNTYTTKGGNKIKLNRSLGDKAKARKDAKMRAKAAYLATLPQGRFKRALYRLQPKRLAKY